ncbi:ribokinase [Bosea sp. RAC05]|uniref:ribokinase n=1 Tax=Bosea sp. RAC05 TaxID=1842539 RepID=UPI00083D4D47|nr:ribokinase [Bosea sp. RAC05]AOG03772.1 phosphomethylpyrimidine kinase family protein [Bosea sp. RAC05]
MSRVVVFGNASLDIILTLEAFPSAGETVLAREVLTCAGGKGLNQALAAARFGHPVHFAAAIGHDNAATLIQAALATEQGLSTRWLFRSLATDMSSIWLDGTGENMISSSNFCAHSVTAADAERELATLHSEDWLVLQGNLTLDATRAAIGMAQRAGARVLLNTAPMQGWMRDVVPLVDVLVANTVESSQMTGLDAEPAVAALLELGAEHVVVTRGSTGASWRSRDVAIDLPAPHVVAVDTAGAGDMFVGSLAASLANKQPLPQALERAITLASFTVTRKGTSTSFPSREEVTRLSPFRH